MSRRKKDVYDQLLEAIAARYSLSICPDCGRVSCVDVMRTRCGERCDRGGMVVAEREAMAA